MVDPAVAIEGLVEQGKLLTLTSKEALAYKYADGEPASLEALLALKGWEGATVVDSSPRPAERVARFVTNPVVAGLLVTLGVLGLIIELQTPGWGLGGGVGLLALGLFFFGHFIAGLAGWEGVALVALGVALIALEAFVIPGFGIAGIAGIIAFIAGIYISLVGDFTSGTDLLRAGYVVAISLLVIVAGVWASLTFLPKRRMGGLVLLEALAGGGRPTPPAGGPPSSPEAHQVSLAGRRGVALTPLHPAGIAQIDGRRVDVVTEGEWLDAGSAIEVVEDTGYRRVVRALEKPSGAAT
jgi:membrane-bound serine protease (ClpP class)